MRPESGVEGRWYSLDVGVIVYHSNVNGSCSGANRPDIRSPTYLAIPSSKWQAERGRPVTEARKWGPKAMLNANRTQSQSHRRVDERQCNVITSRPRANQQISKPELDLTQAPRMQKAGRRSRTRNQCRTPTVWRYTRSQRVTDCKESQRFVASSQRKRPLVPATRHPA